MQSLLDWILSQAFSMNTEKSCRWLGRLCGGGQILEAGIEGTRRHWYSPSSFEGY
jgi:hypothetical protein